MGFERGQYHEKDIPSFKRPTSIFIFIGKQTDSREQIFYKNYLCYALDAQEDLMDFLFV